MEDIEVSANSEEEAVDLALDQLGLDRDEVEVEVLKKVRTGLFGLGHDKVTVRVTPIDQSSRCRLS